MEPKKTWQKKKPASEFDKQIGRRMRECRERLALSTDSLAEALGISASAVTQYELGMRSPSYDRFAAIIQRLGVSADYLLIGDSGRDTEGTSELEVLNMAFRSLSSRDRALVVQIILAFVRVSTDSLGPETTPDAGWMVERGSSEHTDGSHE